MLILRWLFWHWMGSWGKEMPWTCCWEGVYQTVYNIPWLSPVHVPWHPSGAWDGPGGWLWKEDMGSDGWALGKSAHRRGRPWGVPVPQGPEQWVWGRAGRSVKMTVRKLEEAPGLQHWPFPEKWIFLQREGAVKSPEVHRKSAEQTHHQAGALFLHNSKLTMWPHLGWLLRANPLPPWAYSVVVAILKLL